MVETADPRHGDWVQTFTGRAFYPLDPRPADIDIRDIAHHLSMICRYNGAVRRFYSVAEHCVLLCQVVTDRLPDDSSQQLQALMHDAAEAYLCDVVRPVKVALAGYREAEQRVERAIAERFGLLCAGKTTLVDELDNLILYDEAKALMPVENDPWHLAFGPGLGVEIHGYTPIEAEARFLGAFRKRVGR